MRQTWHPPAMTVGEFLSSVSTTQISLACEDPGPVGRCSPRDCGIYGLQTHSGHAPEQWFSASLGLRHDLLMQFLTFLAPYNPKIIFIVMT